MKRYESRARHRAAVSTLTAAPVVLFAVLALIASIAFVGITARDRADAYIPSEETKTAGVKPTVTAVMEGPKSYKEDVDSNGRFDYVGKVTFGDIKKAQEGEYFVTLNASEHAPFESTPSLTVSNGSATVSSSSDTKVTYTLTPSSDGTMEASFRQSAVIGADLPDDTIYFGSVYGEYKPSLSIGLKPHGRGQWLDDPFVGASGKCSTTANFEYVVENGGYLMDVKFGDAHGSNQFHFTEPISDKTITFSGPGIDSSKINSNGKVFDPDPYPPYYEDDEQSGRLESHPNAKWFDSKNWKYKPENNTGTEWLPAGTVITLRRGVEFHNCKNGFTTDGNPFRMDIILSNVQIGKNVDPVSDAAGTAIAKVSKKFECRYINYQAGGGSTEYTADPLSFGDLEPVDANEDPTTYTDPSFSKLKPNQFGVLTKRYSDGMATSDVRFAKGKIFYTGKGGIKYVDTLSENPMEHHDYPTTGGPDRIDGNAAFDDKGVLWLFGYDHNIWGGQTLYSLDVANKATNWQVHGQLKKAGVPGGGDDGFGSIASSNKELVKDLVVDKSGNILFMRSKGDKAYLYVLKATSINSPEYGPSDVKRLGRLSATTPLTNGFGDGIIGSYYGMAWGPDGKLWISPVGVEAIYRIEDLNNLEDTSNYTEFGTEGSGNLGDLSSCNVGQLVDIPSPGLNIAKFAVDPVTGQLITDRNDGGVSAAPNKVKIKNDKATVQYAVKVTNTGKEPKQNLTVDDEIAIPSGMKITKITVDGEDRDDKESGSFNIARNLSLAPETAKVYVVTVTFEVTSPNEVQVNQLTCTGNATNSGFFNRATLTDGGRTKTSDACIPGDYPRIYLKLVKEIVDQDGNVIPELNGDAGDFFLSAVPTVSGEGNSGGVAGPGDSVKKKRVPFGTYKLGESYVLKDGKLPASAGKYVPFPGTETVPAGWQCDLAQVNENRNIVLDENLGEGATVTCWARNTPKAYVQKYANDPKEGEGGHKEHWGKEVKLLKQEDGEYTGNLVYKVKVNTQSPGPITSGEITDTFFLPAGLSSNGVVTIEAKRQGNAIAILDGQEQNESYQITTTSDIKVNQARNVASGLPLGVKLADKIQGLTHDKDTYTYTVTIPVKAADKGKGAFETNKDNLAMKNASAGDAEPYRYVDGNPFPDTAGRTEPYKGAINIVRMAEEDTSYQAENPAAGYWLDDNRAVIPVVLGGPAPKVPKAFVKKLAAVPDGSSDHWGEMVTLEEESDGVFTGKLKYKVVVSTADEKVESTGEVTDEFRFPAGLKKIEGSTVEITGQGSSETVKAQIGENDDAKNTTSATPGIEDFTSGKYVLAKTIKDLKKGETFTFTITIPVQADLGNATSATPETPFGKNADTLKQCTAGAESPNKFVAGKPGDNTGGVINVVSLENESAVEDGLPEGHTNLDNNRACIPVKMPEPPKAYVEKLALTPASSDDHDGHWGAPVTLERKSEDVWANDLEYKVVVKTDSAKAMTATNITDNFKLPVGLKENGEVTIAGAASDGSSAVAKVGEDDVAGERKISYADFSTGKFVLADTIESLKKDEPYTFTIKIPVKADLSEKTVEGEKTTVFASRKKELGECKASEENPERYVKGAPGKTETFGAVNIVDIDDEADEDNLREGFTNKDNNRACIPVKEPETPKAYVKKFAATPADGDNRDGHWGEKVTLKRNADGDYTGNLVYRVEVWTDEAVPMTAKNVTDTFKLPEGLLGNGQVTITGSKAPESETVATFENGNYDEPRSVDMDTFAKDAGEFVLADTVKKLVADKPYTFTITIPVKADTNQKTVDGKQTTVFAHRAGQLGQCADGTDSPFRYVAGQPGDENTNGAVNFVNIDNEANVGKDVTEGYSKDDNRACIPVTKEDAPRAYVQKFAADPADGENHDDHHGKPVTLERQDDGSFAGVLKYTVKVLTDETLPMNTGKITDNFRVPAGLLSNGDVSIIGAPSEESDSKAVIDGEETTNVEVTVPAADFVTGNYVLADSIKNLQAGKPYTFTISIPVKANAETAEGEGATSGTVFDKHADNLKECVSGESTPERFVAGEPGAEGTKGAVNIVDLDNEAPSGEDENDYSKDDNRACIPVVPEPAWKIQKLAKVSDTEWNKTGETVEVDDSGAFEVFYQIRITNVGARGAVRPEFTDTLDSFGKLNADNTKVEFTSLGVFSSEDEKIGEPDATTESAEFNQASGQWSFSAGEKTIPVNAYETVQVKVSGILATGEDWKKIEAECKSEEDGDRYGILNHVEMTGDVDGPENNEACVPLEQKRRILVKKTDLTENALYGAEFAVYVAEPGQTAPDTTTEAITFEKWYGDEQQTDGTGETNVMRSVKALYIGKEYWLVETKAAQGAELLPEPLKFKLKPGEGITPLNGKTEDDGKTWLQDGAYSFGDEFAASTLPDRITVRDPRAMTMPHSGGLGEWPYALGGMVLIGAAMLLTTRRTSGVSVRS